MDWILVVICSQFCNEIVAGGLLVAYDLSIANDLQIVKNQNRKGILTSLKWQDWINAQYLGWRGESISREKSVSRFAAEIGVNHQLMWEWLNRGVPPRSHQSVSKLTKYFGQRLREVEDVVFYTNPTKEELEPIARLIAMLPDELKHAFFDAASSSLLEGEGHTENEIFEIFVRRINENLNK